MERERAPKTPEQTIEGRFGKETLAAAEEVGRSIGEEVKAALAQICYGEGSSRELDEEAKKYLARWRKFTDGLTARTSSENKRSPESVAAAIEGASALMSVGTTPEGREAARKMIEALETRFGIIK